MKILFIGLGSIGMRHLGIAKDLLPNSTIYALQSSRARLNDVKFVGLEEAKKMLFDIVVISSPSSHHIENAANFIDNSNVILIEKPLADSLSSAKNFVNSNLKSYPKVLIGYNLRFTKSMIFFRDSIINQNYIGRPISIRSEVGKYLPSWRPGKDYRKTVSANRDLGGGVLLELSHEIDYLRWIFGPVDTVKASVFKSSNLDIDVEDTVHAIVEFEKNAIISTLSMDFVRHDDVRSCVVIGERGSLRWDGIKHQVSIFDKKSSNWKVLFHQYNDMNNSYIDQWRHLLAISEGKSLPLITLEESVEVLKIIEAIRIAGTTGNMVALSDIRC